MKTKYKDGKLTIYDPEEFVKKLTLEEAKDYLEAIYEEWDNESQAANDSIVEILESYMEFIEIFKRTMMAQATTPKIKVLALELCKKRKNDWKPVLEKAKEMQKARKSAEKTA